MEALVSLAIFFAGLGFFFAGIGVLYYVSVLDRTAKEKSRDSVPQV